MTTSARVSGIRAAVQATVAATGTDVVWWSGWESRTTQTGTPGRVAGIVWHDTVTGPGWSRSQLGNLLARGHSNLSGPLATFGLERDGTLLVIASGRANHAGLGSWRGIADGNGRFLGLEAANGGAPERWTDEQLAVARRLSVEAGRVFGFGATMVCGHGAPLSRRHLSVEWTTRKVDPWSIVMPEQRDRIAAAMLGPVIPTTPPAPEEPDVPIDPDDLDRIARAVWGYRSPRTDRAQEYHQRLTYDRTSANRAALAELTDRVDRLAVALQAVGSGADTDAILAAIDRHATGLSTQLEQVRTILETSEQRDASAVVLELAEVLRRGAAGG